MIRGSITDIVRLAAEVLAVQHGGPSARPLSLSIDEVEFETVPYDPRYVDAFVRASVRLEPQIEHVSIRVVPIPRHTSPGEPRDD